MRAIILFVLVIGIPLLYFIMKAVENRYWGRLSDCINKNDIFSMRKIIEPSLGNLYSKMTIKDLTQALGIAVRHGSNDMVRLFINLGADPKSVQYYSLERACFFRHYGTLELLFDHGVDPDIRENTNYGQTFLMKCIEKGDNDFAEKLLARGANVNAVDGNNTPLLCAVRHDNEQIAKELLKRGADPNTSNNDGPLPLELALAKGSLDSSLMLMEHGCHVRRNDGKLLDSTLPKDTWTYVNNKWNLSFVFPSGWRVAWENEPDGGWEIVVGAKGVSSFSGQTMLTFRILPHAVLNFEPENVKVYASGGGVPIELPRTPVEYAEKCRVDLKEFLPILQINDNEIGSLAGMPSLSLSYYLKSRTGIIMEKQINIFGRESTYRFLCEMPLELSKEIEVFFDSLVAGFIPF
jgi:hypothetical protein